MENGPNNTWHAYLTWIQKRKRVVGSALHLDERLLMDGWMHVFFIHNLNEVSPYHDALAKEQPTYRTNHAQKWAFHVVSRAPAFDAATLERRVTPSPSPPPPPACQSAPKRASAMATASSTTNIINNRANKFSLVPIASRASADHAFTLAWCNRCNVANTAAAGASLHGRFAFQRPLFSPSSFPDGRRGGTRDGTVRGDHRQRLRADQGFSFFQRRPVIRFWDSFLWAFFVFVGLGFRLKSLMMAAVWSAAWSAGRQWLYFVSGVAPLPFKTVDSYSLLTFLMDCWFFLSHRGEMSLERGHSKDSIDMICVRIRKGLHFTNNEKH